MKKDATENSPNALFTQKPNYASFSQRMFAAVIDVVLIMIVALPVCDWAGRAIFPPINPAELAELAASHPTNEEAWRGLWQFIINQQMLERFFVTNLVQLVIIGLYILPFWLGSKHNTPGKRLLRLEIRDAVTFEPMTRKQAVLRFIGYIISAIPLTLGFVWMLFSKKRQCWHDSIAGTIVVKREKKKEELGK